jgi:hypothetical protein
MSHDGDAVTKIQAEHRQLNDELVVPAYRDFCTEVGLPFHFWDELPNDWFDPGVSLDEMPLHKEGMDLFNRLRPELIVFKDRVVRFQFRSWDGDISYDTWSLRGFMGEISDELLYLKRIETRLQDVSSLFAFVCAAVVLISILLIYGRYAGGSWYGTLFLMLGLCTSVGLYRLVRRLAIRRLPRRLVGDEEVDSAVRRILDLRGKLEGIRGTAPDPLPVGCHNRLGMLGSRTPDRPESKEEIADCIRRYRACMSVCSDPYSIDQET